MRRGIGLTWVVVAMVLAACATRAASQASSPATEEHSVNLTLVDLGPAPEMTNEVWLNTDRPLRLADLRGKVVLIDFWTFG